MQTAKLKPSPHICLKSWGFLLSAYLANPMSSEAWGEDKSCPWHHCLVPVPSGAPCLCRLASVCSSCFGLASKCPSGRSGYSQFIDENAEAERSLTRQGKTTSKWPSCPRAHVLHQNAAWFQKQQQFSFL